MNYRSIFTAFIIVFFGCIFLSRNPGLTIEKNYEITEGSEFCYNRNNLWLSLPDFTPFPGGIADTIVVPFDSTGVFSNPSGSILIGVQVVIDTLIHTWLGDIAMTIENGSIVDTLMSGPGAGFFGSSADMFINTRLTDSATIPIESIPNSPSTVTGDFLPGGSSGVDSLKKFNNHDWGGNWILRASDNGGDDTGSLRAWSLCLFIELGNVIISSNGAPGKYSLHQNYPNPFNPATRIGFSIPQKSDVKLIVYDISGKVIKVILNSNLNPGEYNIDFDASGLPSGTYFYRLSALEFTEVKKMVLLK